MPFQPLTENEAYAGMLCEHLDRLVTRLRRLAPEQWDWAPDAAAPTARMIATHAWQWLQCDRQHILEPDASLHARLPDPPSEPAWICAALRKEKERWRELILALTPAQMDEERVIFCHEDPLNVRALVCHSLKNCLYKHGQLSVLFFALGLDGSAPYRPPLPNADYEACYGPASAACDALGAFGVIRDVTQTMRLCPTSSGETGVGQIQPLMDADEAGRPFCCLETGSLAYELG